MLVWQVGMGKVIPKGGWNEEDSESSGWWTVRKDMNEAAREDLLSSSLTCYITGHIHVLNKNSWMKFPLTGAYREKENEWWRACE